MDFSRQCALVHTDCRATLEQENCPCPSDLSDRLFFFYCFFFFSRARERINGACTEKRTKVNRKTELSYEIAHLDLDSLLNCG